MTSKTIRSNGKWLKVTKDNSKFYFHTGYEGEMKAHTWFSYSISIISNWAEAMSLAKVSLESLCSNK